MSDIVERLRSGEDGLEYAAADEIEKLLAGQTWRPIGTAPLNGTEILVWDQLGFADVAFWDPMSLRWSSGDLQLTPTHWMPLPEPPK